MRAVPTARRSGRLPRDYGCPSLNFSASRTAALPSLAALPDLARRARVRGGAPPPVYAFVQDQPATAAQRAGGFTNAGLYDPPGVGWGWRHHRKWLHKEAKKG